MKKVQAVATTQEESPVHFMRKQRMLVSTKTVDYDNLTTFEAVTMSAVFVLAVLVGVVSSTVA
jgi:hypothetical protein